MGDDIGSGSVTDCFPILKDILNGAELHYRENQNRLNSN